jgi:hypothetical protein
VPGEPVEGSQRKHRRAIYSALYCDCVHSDDYCVKKAAGTSHAPHDHINVQSPRNTGSDQTQECGLAFTTIPTQAIG